MNHEGLEWIFVFEPELTDTLIEAAEGTKSIGGRLGINRRTETVLRKGAGIAKQF